MTLYEWGAISSGKIKGEDGADARTNVITEKTSEPAKQDGTRGVSYNSGKNREHDLSKLDKDQDQRTENSKTLNIILKTFDGIEIAIQKTFNKPDNDQSQQK